MTDNERYKRTFDAVASSKMKKLEAEDIMGNNNKVVRFRARGVAVALAAVVLLLGICGGAYAADVGGIQSKLQVWVRGEMTDVTLDISTEGTGSSYTMEYTDENGENVKIEGGGVAYDFFGRERPLTEEEIIEHLNAPEVVYEDDGTVWVFCGEQKVEITDDFDEKGVCHVKLISDGKPIYMTVNYQGGWATDTRKFPKPH